MVFRCRTATRWWGGTWVSISKKVATPPIAQKWGLATAIAKGLALITPWGIIEVTAGKHEYLGYAIGLFVGILCMHAVPPKEKTLGRWLIIGVVMSLVHPALHVVFAKVGR
jgi:hypothetical protein